MVTGASGFVGRWVCRLLSSCATDLYLLTRNRRKLERICDVYAIDGKIIQADLGKPGEFARFYAQCLPDICFNCAGYGVASNERDPALMTRINSELAEEIAQCIADGKTHSNWPGQALVHTGSAFEYGLLQDEIDEHRRAEPNTLYAQTKLEGTQRVLACCATSGLKAVVARLSTVYGPGEAESRLLPSLLKAAFNGESVNLTAGIQERDFTWVGDAAEGLLRLGLLDTPNGKLINLATGRLSKVKEFVDTAAQVLQMDEGQLQRGSLPYRHNEVWQGPLNVKQMQQLTHWLPTTDLTDGISATRNFLISGRPKQT